VLIDRLWPRGVSKAKAHLDLWLKEVAPTPELRTWFDHRGDRFAEFRERYLAELETNRAVDELTGHGDVTLLYAARDREINGAIVLREFLSR
jgi:uncharacterized protein YeaO (DUF488 family)